MATHATTWSGILSNAGGTLTIGFAVVRSGDEYLLATAANRSTYGRAVGVVLTAADTTNRGFEYQVAGILPASVSGLPDGSRGDWVIVDSNGALERVETVLEGTDVIGRCPNTGGDVQIMPGVFDDSNYAGGGGGGGGDASYPIDLSDDGGDVTGDISLATQVSGTLPLARGGTGATSLASGYIKSNGSNLISTPSVSANDIVDVLPTGFGGTGLTTPVVRFTTSAASGTVNNLSLSILSGSVVICYFSDAGAVTLNGVVAPSGGGSAVLILRKNFSGTTLLTLANEAAGSTAANRITVGATTAAVGWALIYNTTNSRWEQIAYPQYEA